jgi:hypothetical protein
VVVAHDNPRYVKLHDLPARDQMSVFLTDFGIPSRPDECFPGIEPLGYPNWTLYKRRWWQRLLGLSRYKVIR